ncbi:MAG: DUF4157 domain-containing protein [Acidimicrobiales bacterium]|nr:DUF4157 domain-containing protein [Acidimicrobiales bacterium]
MSDDTTPSAGTAASVSADAGGPSLGRDIGQRMRPLRARRSGVVGSTPHAGPGTLGRRSSSFTLNSGLSLSSRRELGLAVPDLPVGGLPVAPPAEWDESLFAPERPRTGDATLDHILAQRIQAEAARPKRPAPRRGLLAASSRRSTRVGRNTGPGASARRLSPRSAPPSLDHEVRQAVSGTGGGGGARPRAPRSGPQPAGSQPGGRGGSSRAPGGRTGRRARGRLGRPVPWQQPDSARHSPVAASAAVPPAAAAADTTNPAANAAGPAPFTADVVAVLAGEVVGVGAGGASGLDLPRGTGVLPPGLAAPSRDRSAGPASPAGSTARMATRQESSPDLAARLAAAGSPAADTSSLPVGPGSIAGLPGLGSGSADVAGTARSGSAPAARRPAPTTSSAAGATQATPSGAAGGTERHRVPASSGRPGRPGRRTEPALAAMLRAAPPALMLSAPPARGFAPGAGSPDAWGRGRPGGATAGVASPGVGPAGLASPSIGPAGVRSPGLASTVPSSDLPVSPGGFVVGAPAGGSSASVGSPPASVPGSASASARSPSEPPRSRGLGTVASITTPPLSTRLSAGPRVPASAASGGSASREAPPRADSARRAVRRLPDLGSVAPSMVAPASSPVAGGSGRAPAGGPGRAAGLLPASGGAGPADASVGTRPVGNEPVAPPAAAPTDPGERFSHALGGRDRSAPRPLPERFTPMARAIVPRPDRVRVSTDGASRRALASVGKLAATAGDVVHLARPLDETPRSVDILAHELTHVANPSPLVRFYDDRRGGAEERLADKVGEVMAKAPVGSPPASPPAGGGSGAGGSGAGSAVAGGGAAGANGSGGGGAGSGGGDVDSGGAGGSGPSSASPAGTLFPSAGAGGGSGAEANGSRGRGGGGGAGRGNAAPDVAAPQIDIDRLLDALEARVIRELERRGRRWPRAM